MGYRPDSHYKFVCRTWSGNLGDIMFCFMTMPQDWTVRIKGHSQPAHHSNDPLQGSSEWLDCKGALLTIKFSALYRMGWRSPTQEWLVQFIDAETQRRLHDPSYVDGGESTIDCALFELDEDCADEVVYGVPTWRVAHRVGVPPDPNVGAALACASQSMDAGRARRLSVVEQLRARAKEVRKKHEQEGKV